MTTPYYESDAGVEQYLLFHYGTAEQICPLLPEARTACGFPARCVSEPMRRIAAEKQARLPGRALDLGCAVGRSSLELRKYFDAVVGIDFSARFVTAAERMRDERALKVRVAGESAATVGATAGIAAGAIGAAAGLNTGQAAAVGAGVGLLAAGITYAIAKHEATERQREVAAENARRAYARHKTELRKRRVRYIAVKTTRTKDSQGQASCMVWDTQSEQVVGNTVYDCKDTPAPGSTAKFDSYSAEYVGN